MPVFYFSSVSDFINNVSVSSIIPAGKAGFFLDDCIRRNLKPNAASAIEKAMGITIFAVAEPKKHLNPNKGALITAVKRLAAIGTPPAVRV